MNLIFITGSSGVGKTPLMGILKSILPANFDVHDLDEKLGEADRTKSDWLEDWRRNATQCFVELSIQNAKDNKSTVVCGIVWPHEVESVPNIKLALPVKFVFLDVQPEELKKRLFARRWSDETRITHLKRDTGLTPDEYIEKNEVEVDKLKNECLEHGALVIDTTNLTSEQVAWEIKDWLLE